MKHGLEGIDLNNPIKGKIPKIIEYLVEFYGEEYRDRITERINNTMFLFLDRYFSKYYTEVEGYFYRQIEKLINEFERELLNKHDIIANFNFGCFKEDMNNLAIFKDEINEDNIDKVYYFIKNNLSFDYRITSMDELEDNLNVDSYKEGLMDKFQKIHALFVEKYRTPLKYLFSEEKRYSKKEDPEYNYLSKSLEQKFYMKSENYILETLTDKLNIPITDENVTEMLGMVQPIIDYIETRPILVSRSLKSQIDNICKSLQSMSQAIIFTNGNIIPKYSHSDIEKIILDLKKPIKMFREDQYVKDIAVKSDAIQEILDVAHEYAFSDDCISFIREFVLIKNVNLGGANIATVKLSQPKVTRNICVVDSYLKLYDTSFFHELNHAIMSYASFNKNKFIQKNGLSVKRYSLSGKTIQPCKSTPESYVYLDEVLNEYLSLKVSEKAKNDNFHIGYYYDIISTYRFAFPMLENFFEENLSDLIKCCMSNNENLIHKTFGKKNFDKLAFATSNLLNVYAMNEYKILEKELNDNFGENVDGFSLIGIQKDNLSQMVKDYIECYKLAGEAIEDIRKWKLENSNQIKSDDYIVDEEDISDI